MHTGQIHHSSTPVWFLSVAVSLASILVGCSMIEETGSTKDLSSREGYVLTPDNVSLYYSITGTGPDTLITIHGGPGLHSGYLAPDMHMLESDLTMIHYDQRGSGRSELVSEPELFTLRHYADDLEAIRKHFGLRALNLMGHSWGSIPAAFYAKWYPETTGKIALVSSMPPRKTPYDYEFVQNVFKWMDDDTQVLVNTLDAARRDASQNAQETCVAFWTVFIRGYLADPMNPSVLQRSRGSHCDVPAEALRNEDVVMRYTRGHLGDWDWRGEFAEVQVPVLVLHGELDPIPVASAREWSEEFPNAQLVTFEGIGHFPQFESAEAFAQSMLGFFAD